MSCTGKFINLTPRRATSQLLNLVGKRRVFLVVDQEVYHHHQAYIEDLLMHLPVIGSYHLVATEDNKNLANVEDLINHMLDVGLERSDLLVAIGGGITTDLAGFAASIYKRGMPWLSLPTSLLGMVDAGIGGKTGVNHAKGKNLVGAFHFPEAVCFNYDFLSTLSQQEWLNGYGEIMKYVYLALPHYMDKVRNALMCPLDSSDLNQLIAACVQVKADIVDQDSHENKTRLFLNFGHTYAHVIEHHFNYSLGHGEAVYYGIAVALGLSVRLQGLKLGHFTTYCKWLKAQEFYDDQYFLLDDQGLAAMYHDKKVKKVNMQFVVLKEIGQPWVISVPLSDAVLHIKEVLHEITHITP